MNTDYFFQGRLYAQLDESGNVVPSENTPLFDVWFFLLSAKAAHKDERERQLIFQLFFSKFESRYKHNGRWTPPHCDKKWSVDNNIALARLEDQEGGGWEALKNAWQYPHKPWDLCYFLYVSPVPAFWWVLTPFVFLHDLYSCLFGTYKRHKHNGEEYVDTDGKNLAWIRGYNAKHWFWRLEYSFVGFLMSKVLKTKTPYRKCRQIYFKDPRHPIVYVGHKIKG